MMLLNGRVPGLRCQACSEILHGRRLITRHRIFYNLYNQGLCKKSRGPCPVLPCHCCRDIAGHWRPSLYGENFYCYYYYYYYYYYKFLRILLLLLLLLLLQRPNEFHTESNHTMWCTGNPNNPILDLHWVSEHQLLYCTQTPLPSIMIHVQ